jgi:hypothetical protein
MTNVMFGIEPTTIQATTRTGHGAWWARRGIESSPERVPPIQGGGDLFGPSSQGVALGWGVVAPLARETAQPQRGATRQQPGATPWQLDHEQISQPQRGATRQQATPWELVHENNNQP